MFLVLAEGFSELLGEHGFFLLRLEAVSRTTRHKSQNASPLVDHQSRTNSRQNEAGIDGVSQASVRTGADIDGLP